jgi:hypothetical protein
MGKTDSEISSILNEIRLEAALAMELQMTSQIIKKTGLFNKVDRIYGEPGAEYNPQAMQGEEGMPGGGGGGGMPALGGGDTGFGDELGDMGEPGAEDDGDLGGEEGESDLGEGLPPMEGVSNDKNNNLLTEDVLNSMKFFNKYMSNITQRDEPVNNRVNIVDKSLLINEEIDSIIKDLENKGEKKVSLLS